MALDRVAVSEAVYRATIADSDGRDESWLVSRRVGLDDDVRVPASVAAALGGRQLALLPRGGVAAPLDAAAADRRPARRAFCFLPLPLKTGLPVHVNAHFALDHEARRCLWPDDDAGAKADWNYLLVRDVVAPAYVSLLRRVPHYLSSSVVADNISLMESFGDEIPNLDAYGRLFPALPPGRGYWRSLAEAVYQRIERRQEAVFPVAVPSADAAASGAALNALALDASSSTQLEVEWISTVGEGAARPFFDNLTHALGGPAPGARDPARRAARVRLQDRPPVARRLRQLRGGRRRRPLRRAARRHRLLRAVPERLVPLRAARPAGRRRDDAVRQQRRPEGRPRLLLAGQNDSPVLSLKRYTVPVL